MQQRGDAEDGGEAKNKNMRQVYNFYKCHTQYPGFSRTAVYRNHKAVPCAAGTGAHTFTLSRYNG